MRGPISILAIRSVFGSRVAGRCLLSAACLVFVACGLSVAGSGPSADLGGPDATADSSAGADAGASDVGACPPDASGLGAGGTMQAHAASVTPTIDGDLGDWSCAPFFHLTSSNGFVAKPITITADFALSWTSTHLYLAVRVANGVVPHGSDGTDPYQNDSVELYVLKDDAPTGAYTMNDHQYVVDYKGLAREYGSIRMTPAAPAFSRAVRVSGTSYALEMAVSAEALGHAALSPMKMRFDLELNQSDGSQQVGIVVYSEPAGAPCGSCTCGTGKEQPSCNTHLFAELELVP